MSYVQVLRNVSLAVGTEVDGTPVHPANFVGGTLGDEFIISSVFLPNSVSDTYGPRKVFRGWAEFNIYVPAGTASLRAFELCDHLDSIFDRKVVNGTQFFQSTIRARGLDVENNNLWRVDYLVNLAHS